MEIPPVPDDSRPGRKPPAPPPVSDPRLDTPARLEEAANAGVSEGPEPRDTPQRDPRELRSAQEKKPEQPDLPPQGERSGLPPQAEEARYDPVAAAAEDRAVIAEAVAAITVYLMRPSLELNDERSPDEKRVAGQVMTGAAQILGIADEMLSKGAGQDPQLALAATATQAAAKGETRSARKRFAGSLWDMVWGEVKAISRRLWSMIGHLVKVKEWTVQGQVGNNVLGLASASVSVTFGP
jgi:hypothetical protein